MITKNVQLELPRRTLQRQYGDAFTFYLRLWRFYIEVNYGRERRKTTP